MRVGVDSLLEVGGSPGPSVPPVPLCPSVAYRVQVTPSSWANRFGLPLLYCNWGAREPPSISHLGVLPGS